MIKMIFILGIDGLDYELVEKLDLKNLKQLEYDKIIVPIDEKIGLPLSPEVWSSFLVGKNIQINFAPSSSIVKIVKKILDFFHLKLENKYRRKVNDILVEFGLGSPSRFGILNEVTFLDLTKSKEVNVPFYSYDNKTLDISFLFGRHKLSLDQTIDKIKKLHEYRKKQILEEVDNIADEDVVFMFMHTTDLLQHLLFLHQSEIVKIYIDLNNYILTLKNKIINSYSDTVFLIVSDHGFDFKAGTHSKHAFYSSNLHLFPKPKKITDFYNIILDYIKRISKNQ